MDIEKLKITAQKLVKKLHELDLRRANLIFELGKLQNKCPHSKIEWETSDQIDKVCLTCHRVFLHPRY